MVIEGKGENATGIGRDKGGKREKELNKGILESFGNSPSFGKKDANSDFEYKGLGLRDICKFNAI